MTKKQIYYSRTYRRLRADRRQSLILFLVVVIPSLAAMIFFMPEITLLFCRVAARVLGRAGVITVRQAMYNQLFGNIHYLASVAGRPSAWMCLCNVGVCLAGMVLCMALPTRNRPVSIYLIFNAAIHLISSLWFLFAGWDFPYEATDFSQLYLIQEVGIWVVFLVMTTGVTSILGTLGLGYKLLTVAAVMAYSWVFGLVRYIVFLYLMRRYTMLYMTVMYFTFGPMFDFLYLVMIYGWFINRMVKLYESAKGKEEWEWS